MAKSMPKIPINFLLVPQEFKWYTVITRFNQERTFANYFLEGLKNTNNINYVEDLFIPFKEFVVEYEKDNKVRQKRFSEKIISLYVFVKAKMTEELYWYIRNTNGCATILATGDALSVMSNSELKKIRKNCVVTNKDGKGMKVVSKMNPFNNPVAPLRGDLKKLIENGIGNFNDEEEYDYSNYEVEETSIFAEDNDYEEDSYVDYDDMDYVKNERIKRRKDYLW